MKFNLNIHVIFYYRLINNFQITQLSQFQDLIKWCLSIRQN